MNLLESAGFSRSNPYYIVKQGKVRKGAALSLVHTVSSWLEMLAGFGCIGVLTSLGRSLMILENENRLFWLLFLIFNYITDQPNGNST